MNENKIWSVSFHIPDSCALSFWSEEAKRSRRCCPQCGGGLFTPEAFLLLWDDYRKKIAPVFNESFFGALALHKRLGEALVERFAGLELHPLKFEYTERLRGLKKYQGRELVYKGPEVAVLYSTNRVWADFSGTEWAYTRQCSRCGRADYSKPETARRMYPYLKIPASQIRDKDFFWLHGGWNFCTTAFKTFLLENGADGFIFLDAGEIYDDGDSFVPPVLPEWPLETDDVKNEAPKAAAAPVAAVVEPPKRKPRRKSVLCEDLDPATIQTVEDLVDKYLVKLQTPENESEATCPESLAELKEYIALEISDEIRRMRFLRVAQIQETVYWLWKLYDEGGSPCYAYVARTPQAVEKGVADAFESTPEQFLYLTHYDLYNLYFE